MYDDILMPTDGSAGMDRVIEQAAGLAATHDATIHALYAIDSGSYTTLSMETSWEGFSDLLQQEGDTALSEVERLVGDRAHVERVVVEGHPAREIVDYARDSKCDLIVMGTHGRGGLDRLLLGSVAERVVRTAEVPVMTVRVSERTTEAATTIDGELAPESDEDSVRERLDEYEPEPEPGAR
jgi:nucleotide-binding universal stress UspA family protein